MKVLSTQNSFNHKIMSNNNTTAPSFKPQHSKSDSVSFGMTTSHAGMAKDLKIASQKFVEHIKSGAVEEAGNFLEGLTKKPVDFQNAFALRRDADMDTHFNIALANDQHEIAESFLTFITTLEPTVQKKYFALKGNEGITQFQYAIECKQPKAALSFLEFAASVAPKEAVRYKIPQEIANAEGFANIAKSIKNSEELNTAEKLSFFQSNNIPYEE